ncbi:hypothetical protein D9758_008939 [Tetrapyrgos nigripes]|uniref:Cytochrome b5 heme-binding domain-containing protein n=1 Tax=Tetrapyrgos nigripes TaxID=182062 RepID=A0A8H5GKF8_9AGAR|nr:hypothetical protein D9758_008939 [Tetrapyrgos nigripes]
MWQHRQFYPLGFLLGFFIPIIVPGVFWGDWIGGLCFSCALRMTLVHHGIFSLNSLAHHLGSATFDDRFSPRDHFLCGLLTLGEGNHNFHHQFPIDYRNAYQWYYYDPAKWFIAACKLLGLASHLRVFPVNEIQKCSLTMQLKALKGVQDSLSWPKDRELLPVVTWEAFQEQAKSQTLIVISGFVHALDDEFVEVHPGGSQLLRNSSGKDMTSAFFGGVYRHSSAAIHLLSMKRIGILLGGMEIVDDDSVDRSHSQFFVIKDQKIP